MRNVLDNFQALINDIYTHLQKKYFCMVKKQCLEKLYEEKSGLWRYSIGGLWLYFIGLKKMSSDRICVIKLTKISNLGPCIE